MITSQTRGFTLVESLVAITILLVGVIGPLSIAARGISDGLFARNQIAANYLAQEGLEAVINERYGLVRQQQYSPVVDWLGGTDIANCVAVTTGNQLCGVNAKAGTIITTCTGSNDCDLVFNSDDKLYENPATTGTKTGPTFTRTMTITRFGSQSPQEGIKVTVTVSWYNKTIQKFLVLTSYLFSKG